MVWQTYLGSSHTVMLTLLNTMRERLGLPPAPFKSSSSPLVFNSSFKPQMMDHYKMKLPNAEEQEFLGPIGNYKSYANLFLLFIQLCIMSYCATECLISSLLYFRATCSLTKVPTKFFFYGHR